MEPAAFLDGEKDYRFPGTAWGQTPEEVAEALSLPTAEDVTLPTIPTALEKNEDITQISASASLWEYEATAVFTFYQGKLFMSEMLVSCEDLEDLPTEFEALQKKIAADLGSTRREMYVNNQSYPDSYGWGGEESELFLSVDFARENGERFPDNVRLMMRVKDLPTK